MLENKHFEPELQTGQTIKYKTPEGVFLDACDANIGHLKGEHRKIKAILCDGAHADEKWSVFNVTDGQGLFLDHVAIKGAVSLDQAERFSRKYFQISDNHNLSSPIAISDSGLSLFIDSVETPLKTNFLLKDDAVIYDAMATTSAVVWDDQNNLVSHGGYIGHLLLDMVTHDPCDELNQQVSPQDIASLLIDENCERMMYDAMVMKHRQLDVAMQKIADALKQSSNEEFFIKSVTPIEPFKRFGVVNVGVIFEMSDSQTVTVLFNNPDSTPSKLMPNDVITSWKWLLNKRDVTAVLQPRAVESKKYPLIASRMFKVLVKNHRRFTRTQATKARDEALLEELMAQVEAGMLESRLLDEKYQNILTQIDEIGVRKQQNADNAISVKSETDQALTAPENQGGISIDDADVQAVELPKGFSLSQNKDNGFNGVVLSYDKQAMMTIAIDKVNELFQAFAGKDTSSEMGSFSEAINWAIAYFIDFDRSAKNWDKDTGNAQDNPDVSLDGDEFGEFELPEDVKEFRKAVKDAMFKVVGQDLPCPALGHAVQVRKSGIKHAITFGGDSRKLKALAALKELLANAVYVEKQLPKDASLEASIKAYHILKSNLILEEQNLDARFVIREDDKGNYYYDHTVQKSVIQNAKSPLLDGLSTVALPKSGVLQDELAPLIRNGDYSLDQSIETDQSKVNVLLDDASDVFVLNMFIQTNEQMNNEDKSFLTDLIADQVDLGADATGERLEQIGENLTPELEDLFNQAANLYTDYALKNASSLNG